MFFANTESRQTSKLIVILALAVSAAHCSRHVSVLLQTPSPDGSATLRLTTFSRLPYSPKSVAQLEVSGSTGTTVIKEWQQSDMYPCFAAATWSRNSSVVIAIFRDCWHDSELVAFDVRDRKMVNPDAMRSTLADEIRSEFALPRDVADPISWATSSDDAKRRFAETQHH
jgi:hypothetical protein